jgi:hypothetical protein
MKRDKDQTKSLSRRDFYKNKLVIFKLEPEVWHKNKIKPFPVADAISISNLDSLGR